MSNNIEEKRYYLLIMCYTLLSLLFLYGLFIYDKWDVFSEYMLILIIQIIIYSVILCSIITKIYNAFSKKQRILANAHMLLVIYYLLVFQLMMCLPEMNYKYIFSLFSAAAMLFSIVVITSKENFNERIWGIAINLGIMTGFEVTATKYISIIAIGVLIINLVISVSKYYNKGYASIIKKVYPVIGNLEKKEMIHIYAVFSMVFWCAVDQFVIDKLEKTLYKNILTFTVVGFWVPNLFVVLQYIFCKSPILICGMFFYVFLNNFMFVARLHGNNLRHDYSYVEKVDHIFCETIVNFGENIATKLLRRQWKNFVKTAKDASGLLVGPNGPTRWGATTGAAIGFGTSTYFANEYWRNTEEGNRIAERQAAATEEGNRIAERQAIIAERQVAATEEGNRIAERQAAATEESNRLAKLTESKRYNDYVVKDNLQDNMISE